MKHYMFFFIICIPSLICAQQVIPASGGEATGSGGKVSYSIGQISYLTNASVAGSVSEGAQQPYEIFTVGIDLAATIRLNLQAFPVPTENLLTLRIEGDIFKGFPIIYSLFDIGGKLLASGQAHGPTTQIAMYDYQPGTYFLRINQHNRELKVFKVTKR